MAQIELKLSTERTNYLLYEPANLTVTVKNISGTELAFENDTKKNLPWVSFLINSDDGMPVDADQPLRPPPRLIPDEKESSITIDLTPYYKIRSTGRYSVKALVRLPGKGTFVTQPMFIWISKGDVLWSQKRFVDGAERTYSLHRFEDRSKVYLYLRVEEPEQNLVYVTTRLGELNYAESLPPPIFDKDGNLHILHPCTATSFVYHIAAPSGQILHKQEFETTPTIPRLVSSPDMEVHVVGGTDLAVLEKKPKRAKLSDGQKFPDVVKDETSSSKSSTPSH